MISRLYSVFIYTFFLLYTVFISSGEARVYLDITSPFRKVPVIIAPSGAGLSEEIASIIKKDLELTGFFLFLDYKTSQVEYTIHINALVAERIEVNVIVNDHAEGKDLLRKHYRGSRKLLRAIAHTASNDFFEAVTGKPGVFRTKILYIQEQGQMRVLNFMDWDGFDDRKIFSSQGVIAAPRWRPDGSGVGYSFQTGRKWRIDIINLRTRNKSIAVESKGLNLLGSFSPQGEIYFSSSRTGNAEIYKQSSPKHAPVQLTSSVSINVSPSVSYDGSRVAFVSDRSGAAQIYVMSRNGGSAKRLTFSGSYNTSPQWSPDGKWLAYVGRTNGQNQIFLLKSSDNSIQQLTDQGNNENPSFAPNSMFITFDSDRAGAKGIYIMRIDGGEPKRITPKGIKCTNPQWSPFLE
jgi:TolB protein